MMNQNMVFRVVFMALFSIIVSFEVRSQSLQPCPNGMPAGSGCVPPASSGGAPSGTFARPSPSWENRYGAMAVDVNDDALDRIGVAEAKPSKRSANQTALKGCGSKGCKVVAHVVNGCLASARGDSSLKSGRGVIAFGFGPGDSEAKADAMRMCQETGRNCEVEYLGCSLPVRVR